MSDIRRFGTSARYADVVIHNGTAHWVEVAEDPSADARTQIEQALRQIDATLESIGSNRTRLLTVVVHLADLADAAILNEVWDAWVPPGHPPTRACVQSGLSGTYRVEMIITAAAP